MKDLIEAYVEMLREWRAELEFRASTGQRPKGDARAHLVPVVLFIDRERISTDLSQLPETLRSRFLTRPHRRVMPIDLDGLSGAAILEPWEMKQLRAIGFVFHSDMAIPYPDNPRGRRALDEVEVRLRETLALWVWALMPSIDMLAKRLSRGGDGTPAGISFLAECSPFLQRMAEESLKKRPELHTLSQDSGSSGRLYSLVTRLSDEGRKRRLVLRDTDGNPHEMFGTALSEHFLSRTRRLLRSSVATRDVMREALFYVGLLETLTKANLAASSVFTALPSAARSFEEGVGGLGGRGTFQTLQDAQAGKRLHNAAAKAHRAARLPGVGRPRWLVELIRARAGESFDVELEGCDETGRLGLPAELADGPAAAHGWGRAAG